MTLIDLQGKALYAGDKEVQKAFLGTNRFYSLGPSIEPGQFAIPGMYGEDTLYASIKAVSGVLGYGWSSSTRNYTTFNLYSNRWFRAISESPDKVFDPVLITSARTESRGTIPVGLRDGATFESYSIDSPGSYVLKYDARTYEGETNAGYFSRSSIGNDNIGSYQTYTTEWKTYYEPPVDMATTAVRYEFYLRLQRLPGDLGRVQFKNFEFIPAELL